MKLKIAFGTAALCFVLAVPAAAQQQTAPNVTKAFEDWTVRCYPIESMSPCDMIEVLANNTTKQRVLSVSIAYVPSAGKHTMMIGVPLGVGLAKGVALTAGSYKSPTFKYHRCDPNGCYVEMVVDEAVIQGLSSATTATATFADGLGKAVPINFSLKGFNAARDQMSEWARQKAKAPAPAPAPEEKKP
jgi:invasion protein IalB